MSHRKPQHNWEAINRNSRKSYSKQLKRDKLVLTQNELVIDETEVKSWAISRSPVIGNLKRIRISIEEQKFQKKNDVIILKSELMMQYNDTKIINSQNELQSMLVRPTKDNTILKVDLNGGKWTETEFSCIFFSFFFFCVTIFLYFLCFIFPYCIISEERKQFITR